MSLTAAVLVVTAAQSYLAFGAVFAAVFLWRWVGILDPAAKHGTLGFRILIFPGVAVLWPVFVLRLVQGHSEPPEEWTAHRAAAGRAAGVRHVEVRQ